MFFHFVWISCIFLHVVFFFTKSKLFTVVILLTDYAKHTVSFMCFSLLYIKTFSIFADAIIFVFVLGFALEPILWLCEKCCCKCKCEKRETPDNSCNCECKWPLSWHMFLRYVTTVLFVLSYGLWASAWKRNEDTWNPKDKMFQDSDIIFSVASVMSFLHLTFILRAHRGLGALEISLTNMLEDVFYFAVLFFFLFLSFATGIRKLYSYHASATNKDHHFSR